MSTRATITVEFGPKLFGAIYCHNNGDADNLGSFLRAYYSSDELARALVRLGNASSISKSILCPEGHSFNSPVKGYSVFYGRDRGEEGNEPYFDTTPNKALKSIGKQEYNYLWTSGFWYLNDEGF